MSQTVTIGKSVFNLPQSSVVGPNVSTYNSNTKQTTTQVMPAIGDQKVGGNPAPVVPAAGALTLGTPPAGTPAAPVVPNNASGTLLNNSVNAPAPGALDANGNPTVTTGESYNDIEAAAYDQMTKRASGAISSIEGYYNNLLTQSNANESNRESGINALIGNGQIAGAAAGAAASRKSQTDAGTEQAGYAASMAKDISALYQQIQTNATTLATADSAAQDKIKTDAITSLDTLAKLGKSGAEIKVADPTLWQQLLTQTGYTDYQLTSAIDSNKNNPNSPTVKEIPMASADGTSTIIKRITFDPKTGQSTEQDYTIPMPLQTYLGQPTTTTADGKILQQQPDGTYRDITPGISAATTTSQKDYEYYVNQEKTAGRTPLSFDQWTANSKAPAAVKEYLAAVAGGFKGDIIAYQTAKKGGGAVTLDADTIQFLADQYISSPGTAIPSFGMGAAGMAMRAQFYSAVAQEATAKGLTGQALAAQKAASTAAQSGLTKMQTLYSTTQAAEQTANKNLDLAKQLYDKYGQNTSFPAGNIFINWLNGNVGNAELSATEVALYTGVREYAKVASGAAGSVSGLTDSATKEAENLVNMAMAPGQLESTLSTIKQDMENVKSSQSDSIVNLTDIISNGGTGGNANPPVPPVTPTGGAGGGTSGDNNFDSIWD